jgi:glycosyltransferase involved in cell wall biosynthesis
MLSVVIPAYNEEKCLPATLESVRMALADIEASELIVVDNASTDGTRAIAAGFGATIVDESIHNIARVRNTGAARAGGDILVFIDSDTCVPRVLFKRITELLSDDKVLGGSVDVRYEPAPKQAWIRLYMFTFQNIGRLLKLRQGAAQFSRASVFGELGGYDETIYVGEDVEFQWRLVKHAGLHGGRVEFIEQPTVSTSPRRFEGLGLVRSLFFTHPAVVFLGWRTRFIWKYWYDKAIR